MVIVDTHFQNHTKNVKAQRWQIVRTYCYNSSYIPVAALFKQFNFMKGDLKHLTPLTTDIISERIRRLSNIPHVLKPSSEYNACYFPFSNTCIMDPPVQFGVWQWNCIDTNGNILSLVLSVSDTTLRCTTRSSVRWYALDRYIGLRT
jgi:hypothetical protein